MSMTKPTDAMICDHCGEEIDVQPGEKFVASVNGKVWHTGCAPSTRPQSAAPSPDARTILQSDLGPLTDAFDRMDADEQNEIVERLAEALRTPASPDADLVELERRLTEGVFYDDHDEDLRLLGVFRRAIEALTAPAPPSDAAPIPMLLYCPNCGQQHIDEPDERTPDWTNPPHRSHLCHDCGCIWRPADVPTNGVGAIATKGKADTWATERGNAERAAPPSDSDAKGGGA